MKNDPERVSLAARDRADAVPDVQSVVPARAHGGTIAVREDHAASGVLEITTLPSFRLRDDRKRAKQGLECISLVLF